MHAHAQHLHARPLPLQRTAARGTGERESKRVAAKAGSSGVSTLCVRSRLEGGQVLQGLAAADKIRSHV